MATPNLGLLHIAAAQNQKEVTANAALDGLDVALTNWITEVVGDQHFILPQADALGNMVFYFTGLLSGPRGVTLPSTRKIYIVQNATLGSGSPALQGFALQFGTASSPSGRVCSIEANSSEYSIIYCDGFNVDRLTAEPELQNFYVSTLPPSGSTRSGTIVYCLDGRKVGEAAGQGTGVPVYFSNGRWRVFSTDAPVQA